MSARLLRLSATIFLASSAIGAPVTYNSDIAPIISRYCAPCHRPGEAGPFPLLTYADAQKRAAQIAAVTRNRYMPPWLPEPGYGDFADEMRLTPQQIQTIQDWVAQGAPRAPLPPAGDS